MDGFTGAQVADIQVGEKPRVGPGTSRDLTYTWNAGVTVGKFRVPVHVFYNHVNNTSAEIDVEEEIWLVHPLILAGVGAVVLGAIGTSLYVVGRRRGFPRRPRAIR
jgi:hypothetical protein